MTQKERVELWIKIQKLNFQDLILLLLLLQFSQGRKERSWRNKQRKRRRSKEGQIELGGKPDWLEWESQ